MRRLVGWLVAWSVLVGFSAHASQPGPSRVVETQLVSQVLAENRIGIEAKRSIHIYLPRGYDQSTRSYPVIYHFHSIFWSPRQMFEDGAVKAVLDRSIAQGTIDEFILVAADFTTAHVGSFYGNAPATGRWLDFITGELVPFIDRTYRTLPTRQSRALTGDFLGGYVALKLAMLYPGQFGAVYALHPVGTGKGLVPMTSRPDWRRMNRARSWDDLAGDPFSMVFMAMAQAYLPNPERPPFYCDLMVDLVGDELVVNTDNSQRLASAFLLDDLLGEHGANLKQVAVAFDWGRYDPNQDHVLANQRFTRELDDLGIRHLAEEYNGNHYDKNWIDHGRVEERLLPFLARHLAFQHDLRGKAE